MTAPKFHDRAAGLFHTAMPDDTIVVATANGGGVLMQCHTVRGADLVHIARSVLDQAFESLSSERGDDSMALAAAAAHALKALPDRNLDGEDVT